MARELGVNITTPRDVRKRYVDGGIDRALFDAPRPGQPPILTGKQKAKIVALACTAAWPKNGNRKKIGITWQFTKADEIKKVHLKT